MDTLDRYLSKEFFLFFVLIWLMLALLFLAVDFSTRYWDLGMGFRKVIHLYLLQVPGVLQQFLPVAILMTTLLILSLMNKQNEIVTLYLGGVSLWRLTSSFIAIVATISTFCFLFFDSWVPYFEKKRTLLRQGLDTSDEHLLLFGNERFWYRSGKVICNVGRYIPDRNILEDLNIYVLDTTFKIRERIQAKTATFVDNEWNMENGFSVNFPASHYPIVTPFESRSGVIPEKPADFKTLRVEESIMRLRDLRHYIERNRSYGFDTVHPEVSYHERVALIFAPLVFVIFAVLLSTRVVRSPSAAQSVGLSFFIVLVYFIFFRVSLSVGRGGHIPPMLAGWAANIIFMIAAGAVALGKAT